MINVKGFDSFYHTAAATAAITDIAQFVFDIVPGLGQAGLFALFQQCHGFRDGDRSGQSIMNQNCSRCPKGQTVIRLMIACFTKMLSLVTAGTQGNSVSGSRFDNM